MERLAVLVLVLASVANAAPGKPEARVEFDRGVAAYSAGTYGTAADAFAKSYALEPDPETLFAWAQSERKHGYCEKALELYSKMLSVKLTEGNRKEVNERIAECKAVLAKSAPNKQEPNKPEPVKPQPIDGERRAWYKDPVGGALVGIGLASAAVGTVFLVQARNAKQDRSSVSSYEEYMALHERAHSRGQLGVIAAAAGGALVVTGIVWYAVRTQPRTTTITGWLHSTGGGVAIGRAF